MGVGARPGARFARRLLREQLARVLALAPGLYATASVEAVHDLRVAQRRTRVLLRELSDLLPDGADGLRSNLRWVAKRTGPVRDLDMLIAVMDGRSSRAGARRSEALKDVVRVLEKERAGAAARVVGRMESDRHAAMIETWRRIAGPARRPDQASKKAFERTVGPRLSASFDRLIRVIRTVDERSGDSEIHRVRISAKTVRYLVESLEAARPSPQAAEAIRLLKAVQDRLGAYQDLVVHCAMLDRRIRSKAFRDAAVVQAELGVMSGRKAASRPVVLRALGRIDSQRFRALVQDVAGAA